MVTVKHGGPDLGPTRTRAIWDTLGVAGLFTLTPGRIIHGLLFG